MKSKFQYENVIEAMEKYGGVLTLGKLYDVVDISGWKTKTPFATIRRIVQDPKYFFKIRPGLWGLNSYKYKYKYKHLAKQESISINPYNHTYYQGLLIEIGNLRGYDTFVPNQDKNRIYINKKLSEITSLNSILNFSYDGIVNKAKTIDVIWFDNKKLPNSFFEVEHNTNFSESLLKFSELTGFYSKFYIVSSHKRKKEYLGKLERSVFKALKDRVTYVDYENLSRLHANEFEMYKTKQLIKF